MPMPSGGATSAFGGEHAVRREDPLAAVLELGWRASRDGLIIGIVIALLSHSLAIASPFTTLMAMRNHAALMREDLHSFFWSEYEVDIVEDDRKDEPQPEQEPEAIEEPDEEPLPEEAPAPLEEPDEAEDEPYPDNEPPPAPAEAADTLTAEPTDDPVELDGTWTVPDKDGSTSNLGGRTAGKGTSKAVVRSRNASTKGKPGGTGKGKPKPRKRRPKKSKARPASLAGSRSWNCPFPPQADLEQVDRAIATVAVTVGPNGRAKSARIISDPGYGFGQMARRCALSRTYQPALDADGRKITSTTPPLRVHFRR